MKIETLLISGMSLSELLCLFGCEIQNDDDFYFRLAQNISLTDPDYLPMRLHEYNGARLRGAIFGIGLSPKRDEKQKHILLSLLSHSDSLIIAQAIDALRHAAYEDLWPHIKPFLRHSSRYVIGAALRYARFALPHDESLSILTDALSNSDSIVRQVTLDELGDHGDNRALPFIRPFCDDPDPDVRQAANTAYETIAEVSKEREQP